MLLHVHPCVCRYIWAHRQALARSVHDMAKQMYNNKKYSPVAWMPLRNWLFNCPEDISEARCLILKKFNAKDDEFHKVVALSLWNLARGANLPWGRGAVQTKQYAEVPIHEKVIGVPCSVTPVFFLSFDVRNTHICAVHAGSHVCDRVGQCSLA